MSELDFDELDKAVNALMGDVSSKAPKVAKPDDGTKTITIPSTLPDNVTLPQDNPATAVGVAPRNAMDAQKFHAAPKASNISPSSGTSQEAAGVSSESSKESGGDSLAQTAMVSERQTLPTRRRTGRFMDVVHPSSDMKNPLNAAPSSRPSRTGVSLKPMGSVEAAIKPADEPEEDTITPHDDSTNSIIEGDKSEKVHLESSDITAPQESEWPDPLVSFEGATTSELPTNLGVESETVTSKVPAADEEELAALLDEPETDPLPLVSPFLANTKVEKRPLGGAIETEASEAANTPDLDPQPVKADKLLEPKEAGETEIKDQLPADPVDAVTKASLPEELQTDLVAIESDSGVFAEKVHNRDSSNDREISSEASAATSSTAPSQRVRQLGAASITPQYKEVESTGDHSNGSIYDTAAYHKPLAHPAKKKSGWLWVIWVVLLLLVGGGGAAALYYAGLI